MDSKRCFKCSEVKPLGEFYVHPQMGDGRLNKCKACTKRDVAENYRKNIAHYVVYERERFTKAERKEAVRRYQATRRDRDPAKAATRAATSNAIRTGKLVRKPCEVCGEAKSEAHHDDYTKPLDVRWLCRVHHMEHHGKTAYALIEARA